MATPFDDLFAPAQPFGGAPPAPAPQFDLGPAFAPAALVGTDTGAPAFGVPAVATPPITPVPPARPPLMRPPQTPESRGPNFLSMALPLIASALIGGKDPRAVAEGLAAFMQGRELRRAERETFEQREIRRRQEQAEFYSRAISQAQTFDDPVAFEQWQQAIAPVAEVHGIDPQVFTFNNQKQLTREKKEAADLLEALDEQHPDGNYTAQWKGRRVTRAELAAFAGQAAFDAQGTPIGPSVKPPTAKQPPDAGSFEDYVARFAKARGKTVEQLTDADIEAARKRYNQADDKTSGTTDVTTLSAAGLDMAALMYKTTGMMPALGMGDKTTRQRLINRAAELTPADEARIRAGSGDIAATKATYRANSDTLTKLTQQRAAIGAFEQTAQKNIDLFLEQAGNVVDSGSPLANRLLRTISGQVLGSPNQAAFDAARQVAINEIAKITSNPTLAGQLSDSARHEVEAFNPQSATLKQSVAVMRLLKRDMANRMQSLDEEIARVQRALRGQASAPAPTPAAAPAATATSVVEEWVRDPKTRKLVKKGAQ